jgi:hypothetical protein
MLMVSARLIKPAPQATSSTGLEIASRHHVIGRLPRRGPGERYQIAGPVGDESIEIDDHAFRRKTQNWKRCCDFQGVV